MIERKDLRNIAIIAHVDHGKTTLVDSMFSQSGLFRDNQSVAERAMDSNDLEKERGITILSKNTSITWGDVRINIVDTPGHADFSGEVERILSMVDGVLVLVDAAEGPMPQTRFVLERALALSLPLIIVVNKIDKPDANPDHAMEETQFLLMELGASDEQLDSPVVFASGRDGKSGLTPEIGECLSPLHDMILEHIPCPKGEENDPLQLQVSTIDYNDYVGRTGIGKITRGSIAIGDSINVCNPANVEGRPMPTKVTSIMVFDGLKRTNVENASVGDIVAVSGIDGIEIGDTICPHLSLEPLPVIEVAEPTVAMTFLVNNSPFAGQDGEFVTSRQIWSRLEKEGQSDVALRIDKGERADSFKVCGRGELHLSILVETMRREGYEFMVSRPEVILHKTDSGVQEPIEKLYLDVPDEYIGSVMEELNKRKGELVDMVASDGRTKLEYTIPSRGLFGFRGNLMTDTRGEGVMNSSFDHYGDYCGDILHRHAGVLVSTEKGESVAYSLNTAQKRGQLFMGAGERVYGGMIIGLSSRPEDITLNVCKTKKLTNTRSSGKDDNVMLAPPIRMSLEEALMFINDDEYLEVTPLELRLRKVTLNTELRLREVSKKKAAALLEE
jgi:GTP-binding protein